MVEPLVLVSGFGPFERFGVNPSGEVARALAETPPPGMRVRAAVLPVSFAQAPDTWDRLRGAAGPEVAALYLGLGVQRRAGFRLERAATPRLKRVARPDVDGRSPAEFGRDEPGLVAEVDLVRILAGLRRRRVGDVRISRSAGGFVCEWIYHHLLTRGRQHGVPAFFVHIPPLQSSSLARQVRVVGWVLEEALAGLRR